MLPFIIAPDNPERKLYYAIGKGDHDIESLCHALWAVHEDFIVERRFSREEVEGPDGPDYGWVRFNERERTQIRTSLLTTRSRESLPRYRWRK
jgi:hypothetical protein